jgi:hypothetical protein
MNVVGEVDGHTVEVDTFLSQVRDDTSRAVISRLIETLESVESAPCLCHHRVAEIVLAGTSLHQMSVDILACCDELADVVNNRIKTDVRPRISRSWRRPLAAIRAT